jgi:hypothetical protein
MTPPTFYYPHPAGAPWVEYRQNPSVLILGDPASLYVCSDRAGLPEHLVGVGVVTGSTAPRVPLEAETLAELHRVHIAGFASNIR